MPARGPVLKLLRRERTVPHVEVCDHATGGGAVQVVVVVAAEQVHLHKEGERYLQVLEILVHIVDIEEVAILEDGDQFGLRFIYQIDHCFTNAILASLPFSHERHMWFQTKGLKML